jgi:hypothetical protein
LPGCLPLLMSWLFIFGLFNKASSRWFCTAINDETV